tara:strand:- start:2220 stop:3089 length:870 start_codon:yes stop_codon:yes gene_type:complete
MARSITDIQNEIITAIQADATLSGLTSTSAVAIWRLVTRVIAASLETEEQINDVFKLELEKIAREAVPGTAEWLQKRVLEFQYSATSPQITQVVDGRVTYPVLNTALRVVTAAAVKEQANGRVLVKAAKDDGSGNLTPLIAAEKVALEAYLSRIGFVGIPIDVTSQQPDRVRLTGFKIYYLRQYTLASIKAAVNLTVATYLKEISTTNFDGIIVRSELIDRLQLVTGVVTISDYNAGPILRDFATVAPSGVFINVQRETAAGYAIAEDATGYTLDDEIIYLTDDLIPNI